MRRERKQEIKKENKKEKDTKRVEMVVSALALENVFDVSSN